MKRCKDCRFAIGFGLCVVGQEYNFYTDTWSPAQSRTRNAEGQCPDYERVRWKFWRPK